MRISYALSSCATLRGAKLDRETLKLYTAKLTRYDVDDVMTALEKLSEMPRQEYESAMPALGALTALVEVCRNARQNRSTAEKSRKLVYFHCAYCGTDYSGYFSPGANVDNQFCRSKYGPVGTREILPFGQICGRPLKAEWWESYEDLCKKTGRNPAFDALPEPTKAIDSDELPF